MYCLARSPRKGQGFTVVAIAAIALVIVAGPGFWNEIGTSADYQSGTADVRIEIWKTGLRMWRANPLLGVGPGNFRWVFDAFQSEAQFDKFGRSLGGSIIAHSLPIELVAELGLAGLILLAFLVVRTWRDLGKVRDDALSAKTPEALELRCYADATRGAILALLANGVFLSLLYYSHIWLLLAMGAALPFVARRVLTTSSPAATTAPRHRPRGFRARAGPPRAALRRFPSLVEGSGEAS